MDGSNPRPCLLPAATQAQRSLRAAYRQAYNLYQCRCLFLYTDNVQMHRRRRTVTVRRRDVVLSVWRT